MESGKSNQNTGKTVEYEDNNQRTHFGKILYKGRTRIQIKNSNDKIKWIIRKQVIKIWGM